MNEQYATILANFAFCSGVCIASLCRLGAMSKDYRFGERLKYVILLAGASVSALQGPAFGERPGISDVIMAAAMLTYLTLGMWRWRDGAPEDAHTDFSKEP